MEQQLDSAQRDEKFDTKSWWFHMPKAKFSGFQNMPNAWLPMNGALECFEEFICHFSEALKKESLHRI